MWYLKKKYNYRFANLFIFVLISFGSFTTSFSSPLTSIYNDNSDESITASITARYRVFEAEDCQLSGMKLRATAESCQASDKLIWKYIVTNTTNDEVIQYSYNFSPTPLSGVVGDHTLDIINQTVEANMFILDNLPLGEYKVSWTLTINDEYSVSKEQYFLIVDNTAPIPELYNIIEINDVVKARDFDKGDGQNYSASTDNCSSDIYFTFSDKLPDLDNNPEKWAKQYAKYGKFFYDPKTGNISTESDYLNAKADAWLPSLKTSEKAVNSKMIYNHKNKELDIYIWDEFIPNDDKNYNNYSIRKVNFSSTIECFDFEIDGKVKGLKSGLPLKNMNLTLWNSTISMKTKTDTTGYYKLIQLYSDKPFTIKATKDSDWLNGITTLDIVLIQRHLLGIKRINDPYKLYAADVNSDKKISASDILALRKLILGKTNKFNNNSWVGIPSNVSNTNTIETPSDLDKIINTYFSANEASNTIDFDAIKIGDINQNANAYTSRSEKEIYFLVENREFGSGEILKIPVLAKDFKDILGGQFSIDIKDMDYLGAISGSIKVDSNNFNQINNTLIFSWNSQNGQSVDDNEILFTLTFQANSFGALNETISTNKNSINSEFYQGEKHDILKFSISFFDSNNIFQLMQNKPNPFSIYTNIGFVLEDDNEYVLSIFDLNGKLFKQIKGYGNKGYNSISINTKNLSHNSISSQLKTPRLMLYQLISGKHSAIKKMLVKY